MKQQRGSFPLNLQLRRYGFANRRPFQYELTGSVRRLDAQT